jgi:hypothetical protein
MRTSSIQHFANCLRFLKPDATSSDYCQMLYVKLAHFLAMGIQQNWQEGNPCGERLGRIWSAVRQKLRIVVGVWLTLLLLVFRTP